MTDQMWVCGEREKESSNSRVKLVVVKESNSWMIK